MVPNKKQDILAGFSDRLNQLCDAMGVPPKGRNRQAALAALMGVSLKGARKWLEGEGLPTLDKAIQLACWGSVSLEWLMTGRGAIPPDRLVEGDGAAGIPPALPGDLPRLVGKLAALTPARRLAIEGLIDAFG